MSKAQATRWCCGNRDCNWFMVATKATDGKGAPKCVCGGAMKKVEMLPVLNYLDFLRDETVAVKEAGMDEE
jgi:hypothetical protein